MELHAHPIEILWVVLALAAAGGTIHAVKLAIEDRAVADYAVTLQNIGAPLRLQMAQNNLLSEAFRFCLALLILVAALVSLFSQPATLEDFDLFPQTLVTVIVGCLAAVVISLWAVFDIVIVRKIGKAPLPPPKESNHA